MHATATRTLDSCRVTQTVDSVEQEQEQLIMCAVATVADRANDVIDAQRVLQAAEVALQSANDRLALIRAETPLLVRRAELLAELATVEAELLALRAPAVPADTNGHGTPIDPALVADDLGLADDDKPGATVTPKGEGMSRDLSRKATKIITDVIGRRKAGCLSPLDCDAAQSILDAVDGGPVSTGDSFTVHIFGRKTALSFEVIVDGLSFTTIPIS